MTIPASDLRVGDRFKPDGYEQFVESPVKNIFVDHPSYGPGWLVTCFDQATYLFLEGEEVEVERASLLVTPAAPEFARALSDILIALASNEPSDPGQRVGWDACAITILEAFLSWESVDAAKVVAVLAKGEPVAVR